MEIIDLSQPEHYEKLKAGMPIAQGEVRIWLKEAAPHDLVYDQDNLKEIDAENGMLIVAHSETGHHHAIEVLDRPKKPYSKTAQRLIDSTNDLIAELRIHEKSKLIHHRGNDTHRAYLLPPGVYVSRIDTEFVNDAYRRVAD